MKKTMALVAVLSAFLAGAATAHDYTLHYEHLVKLHAPGTAQDQAVTRATARIGVLATHMRMPGEPFPSYPKPPYWAGDRTVELARVGDHFFAKERLSVMEIPGGHRMGPVMMELTLHLADGETLKLRAETVSCLRNHNTSGYEDFNRALADELGELNASTDASESSCVTVSLFRRGFPY